MGDVHVPADGVGWGGGVGDVHVPCTSYMIHCIATLLRSLGSFTTLHVATLLMGAKHSFQNS